MIRINLPDPDPAWIELLNNINKVHLKIMRKFEKYLITNAMKKESKSEAKVHRVMSEYKEGKLKSSSGKKVKSRKQAIAIAISESKRRK